MLLATINLHPFEIVSRIFSCAEDGQKIYPKKVGKTVSPLRGSWEDNENYLFGYILFITIHLKKCMHTLRADVLFNIQGPGLA